MLCNSPSATNFPQVDLRPLKVSSKEFEAGGVKFLKVWLTLGQKYASYTREDSTETKVTCKVVNTNLRLSC